jgi:glycosyltransferase involved in cell wall biosynthesis
VPTRASATVIVPFYPGARSESESLKLLQDCLLILRKRWRSIIIVEDGTRIVPASDDHRIVRLYVNTGKVSATRVGIAAALEYTDASLIGVVDFDDEQSQEDLEALFASIVAGEADAALGNRYGFANAFTPSHRLDCL